MAGHHTRLKNPRKKGSIPWNKGTGQLYQVVCVNCSLVFESRDKRARFHSPECYHSWNAKENNPLWRGGKPKTKYQWVMINGKKMRGHRHIMAEHLGRTLRKIEVVHHIDEDGLNNQLDNLYLFHCDSCHKYHHRTQAPLQYEYPEAHRGPLIKTFPETHKSEIR